MKDLPVYLNDHLAGSVGALEMLDDMIKSHKGKPLEDFLTNVRNDIDSDQNELKELIKRLGIDESTMRKAGAWMMEELSRAKLHVGDSGDDPNLELVQSLEALALGITGKRSLWRTLGAVGENSRRLQGIDFGRLEARADDQFKRVESQGLEISRQLFGPDLIAAEG